MVKKKVIKGYLLMLSIVYSHFSVDWMMAVPGETFQGRQFVFDVNCVNRLSVHSMLGSNVRYEA